MSQYTQRVVDAARKRQAAEVEERKVREQLRRICARLGPRRPYRFPRFVSEGEP